MLKNIEKMGGKTKYIEELETHINDALEKGNKFEELLKKSL